MPIEFHRVYIRLLGGFELTMIHALRLFAIIEGISLLTLFFVAMPLKYYLNMPEAVTLAGWMHGILFMGLVLYATFVAQKVKLTDRVLFMLIVSSMLPFGMVFMDKKLKTI